jgi:hypothetical protein
MNGREALIRLMQGLWSNFISLSSLILHSTSAGMVKKLGIGKLWRVFKRDYAFYIFFNWQTKVELQKATFHHHYAIDQRSRSLLYLFWAQSQLPPVHDNPVLNKFKKTCLPGKENLKKLILYKKE